MSGRRESPAEVRLRSSKIVRILRRTFPEVSTALRFENPFELLIATILSAQCTDERVNKVTPGLFRKYPSPKEMAGAIHEEMEQEIRSAGFFRSKSRNIIACCRTLVAKHGGEVPASFEALVELPGVGRKTANCVMGGAFGVNSGVVVDTHVQRLAGRLGFSEAATADDIEADLMKVIPRKDWYDLSNLLILHGRRTCNARKPLCSDCGLAALCPSASEFLEGKRPLTKSESYREKIRRKLT